jgi:hypothetical protein
LVCEPALAEAMHLLARFSTAQNALFGLLENDAVKIAFRVEEHIPVLRKLRKRPTNPALVGRCRAWEVCSVIGKLVSMHDDGYDFDRSRAPATVDDL